MEDMRCSRWAQTLLSHARQLTGKCVFAFVCVNTYMHHSTVLPFLISLLPPTPLESTPSSPSLPTLPLYPPQMIEAARANPVVARLYDPTFTGTVFVPMDAGFKDDGPKLARKLGAANVDNVITNPTLAAQVTHTP